MYIALPACPILVFIRFLFHGLRARRLNALQKPDPVLREMVSFTMLTTVMPMYQAWHTRRWSFCSNIPGLVNSQPRGCWHTGYNISPVVT